MKNGRFKVAKGFVMGVLCTLVLSGTVLMANTQTRELIFGVSVSFDGQAVQFDADSQPFTIDSRTFLPVRAIADIAGLGVDFDGATNTVILTSGGAGVAQQPTPTPAPTPAPQGTAFMIAVPPLEVSNTSTPGGPLTTQNSGIRAYDSVTIEGREFYNPLVFNTWGSVGASAIGMGGREWSIHLLNNNYTTVSGYLGRVQGTPLQPAIFRFFGDDVLLGEFNVATGDGLVPVNLDVSGVRQLRIEAGNPQNSGAAGRVYAFVGTIE